MEKLIKIYGEYKNIFSKRYFLCDKLIFDDFEKLKNNELKGIILGEAPGKDEYEKEIPFIGKAGQNLRNNLDTSKFWITNTIKYRPVFPNEDGTLNISKNRTPNNEDINLSIPFLINELNFFRKEKQLIDILILGLTGLKAIKKIFKYFNDGNNQILFFYNDTLKDVKLNDLNSILNIVNKEITLKVISNNGKELFFGNFFITLHPSPLNYNKKNKKELFIKGIKLFYSNIFKFHD